MSVQRWSDNARWTIGMTIFGLSVAVITYMMTDSFVWAGVGLLASGMVVNAFVHPASRR